MATLLGRDEYSDGDGVELRIPDVEEIDVLLHPVQLSRVDLRDRRACGGDVDLQLEVTKVSGDVREWVAVRIWRSLKRVR